jgi:DNA-binding transcriptional regulator PaaX
MRAKTELFLYMLSWRGEQLSQPTCHRIQQSFEGWAYQNGLLPRIQKLEAEGFLAKHPQAADLSGVMQLTEKGRQAALGGHDPEKAWTRKWDRTWHMILFDLPADETALRKAFLRTLRANGFGCLQGSVWISPCIPGEMTTYLKGHPTRPCRLLHLKAKSSGKQADMRLVKDGWNFSKIENHYDALMQVLNAFDRVHQPAALLAWARREWAAWKKICDTDPFLPRALHPPGYPGPEIYAKRQQILKQAGILASDLFVSPETNFVEG